MKPAPPRASRRRYPAASGVVGPSYITTCDSPLFSGQLCAVRPNLASPDQARSRPAPRRPAHPQTASNVFCTLQHNFLGCKACQVRANTTARLVVGCRLRLLAPLRANGNTPSGQVSISQEVYMCQEHAAHDACRGYQPAREPSDRPNLRCFMHCRSMSRASWKRARTRTGLLNPTNTCPRALAQHLTLAGSVGVPELVTNC